MEKIVDRIRKLLALAGNNTNENEALVALEKAHALLAEHNLSMAEVKAKDDEPETKRVEEKTETNLSERYYRVIWNGAALLNYCYCISERPSPFKRQTFYYVIGREINTIVATEFALYLCQTMKRLMNEECKRVGRKDNAFKESFLKGMSGRLWQRMEKLREKPVGPSNSNALVLYRDEEVAAGKRLWLEGGRTVNESKKRRLQIKDSEGYSAGREQADSISFERQVKGERREQIA
jgi:hypothetical protein